MYFKQVNEIVERRKTCTQRGVKPGQSAWYFADGAIRSIHTESHRIIYEVGKTYAVSPGRGKRTALVKPTEAGVEICTPERPSVYAAALAMGYCPLRIRLLKIERVHVQEMDEAVAVAEGVADVAAYIVLWQSINSKTKGFRWQDNPMVWRLWFEVA